MGTKYRDLFFLLLFFCVLWGIFSYFFSVGSPFEAEDNQEHRENNRLVEKLGDFYDEAIEKEYTLRDKEDALVAELDSIKSFLLESCTNCKKDYEIYVINDSILNAFTLPNRKIYFFTGLLEQIEKPELIAAVMAHEIGHGELLHAQRQLERSFTIEAVLGVLTGGNQALVTELGKNLLSLKYTRIHEKEADEYAQKMLIDSGVGVEVMSELWLKWIGEGVKEGTQEPEGVSFFQTHPMLKERLKTSLEYKNPEDFKLKEIPITEMSL